MQVLVTGGAGFIGANLVRRLIEDPDVDAVRVLDDLSTGSLSNLEGLDGIDLRIGSVADGATAAKAVAGADAVVHLAALPSVPRSCADPVASHHANATGTLQLLEAVRQHGCPHVVAASSSSVYGDNPTLPKHEQLPVAPMSPYAVSKLAAETYSLAYGACFGIPVLAFRFFNVFGPLQAAGHAYAAVIPAFVEAALSGKPIPIHGDGLQSRDFTYVGSVTAIINAALRDRVAHERAVNLAFGSRRTLLDVVNVLEAMLGHPLARAHHDPRPGDVRHSQADRSSLEALFGNVEATTLEDGMAATVAWFQTGRVP